MIIEHVYMERVKENNLIEDWINDDANLALCIIFQNCRKMIITITQLEI